MQNARAQKLGQHKEKVPDKAVRDSVISTLYGSLWKRELLPFAHVDSVADLKFMN